VTSPSDASEQPIGQVASHHLQAAEAELYGIGRELHDEGFQGIVATGLLLDQAGRAVRQGDAKRAAALIGRARRSLADVQELILGVALRSGHPLGGHGDLERSIRARLRLDGLQQTVRVTSMIGVENMPDHVAAMLHRLVWQMIRDAQTRGAGEMSLSISCAEDGRVVVSLEDDARRSELTDAGHWASARARVAGGTLTRTTRRGQSTTTIDVPAAAI
jgi:hypothetical protein